MPRISGEANGDGVQAVVLALRILEYLAEQGKAVGVTALAQALGTTKSRIYRHLRTLVQQGYIQQSADTDRYRVGTRLLTLGVSVAENFDLTKAAQGILRELRDALGHFLRRLAGGSCGRQGAGHHSGQIGHSKSASSRGRCCISTAPPRARSRLPSAAISCVPQPSGRIWK